MRKIKEMIKWMVKKIPFIKKSIIRLNNLNERTEWVKEQLKQVPKGSLILDAGCGSQQFRKYASHLDYRGQDFGQYQKDEKIKIDDSNASVYEYGELDYVGDIWSIDEKNAVFDAVLCTEVLEHIPYPNETIKEFSRLLKPGGKLILTAPGNCLRHMDPYFFYSGFSDRWYERVLSENGFTIKSIEPVGDYYSWMGVEIARTAGQHSYFYKFILFPVFVFFFTRQKTKISTDTLCMGYHVIAEKE